MTCAVSLRDRILHNPVISISGFDFELGRRHKACCDDEWCGLVENAGSGCGG
jgi:hypothetical protein